MAAVVVVAAAAVVMSGGGGGGDGGAALSFARRHASMDERVGCPCLASIIAVCERSRPRGFAGAQDKGVQLSGCRVLQPVVVCLAAAVILSARRLYSSCQFISSCRCFLLALLSLLITSLSDFNNCNYCCN